MCYLLILHNIHYAKLIVLKNKPSTRLGFMFTVYPICLLGVLIKRGKDNKNLSVVKESNIHHLVINKSNLRFFVCASRVILN